MTGISPPSPSPSEGEPQRPIVRRIQDSFEQGTGDQSSIEQGSVDQGSVDQGAGEKGRQETGACDSQRSSGLLDDLREHPTRSLSTLLTPGALAPAPGVIDQALKAALIELERGVRTVAAKQSSVTSLRLFIEALTMLY